MSVVWWLLIINVAVVIHELGHYLLARWQGVGVGVFSVGFGPVLARRRWRGTEWRLSALPLGGYVQIDGMVPEDGKPAGGYMRLPVLGKVAILLAGPAFNLLAAVAILSGIFATQGVNEPQPGPATVAAVTPDSRAEALGLRAGDRVLAVEGESLAALPSDESVARVMASLRQDGPRRWVIERGEQRAALNFDWNATVNGERQLLGVSLAPVTAVREIGPVQAVGEAGRVTVEAVPQVIAAFGGLLRSMVSLDVRGQDDVVGPIGTVQVVGQMAAFGGVALLLVAAMINISLAVFNLLPIPFLDGGRVLLVLVSAGLAAVRGRPLSADQEGALMAAGFFFLMVLMAFVIVRDVLRLV